MRMTLGRNAAVRTRHASELSSQRAREVLDLFLISEAA